MTTGEDKVAALAVVDVSEAQGTRLAGIGDQKVLEANALDASVVRDGDFEDRGCRQGREEIGHRVDEDCTDHADVGDEAVAAVANLCDGLHESGPNAVAKTEGVNCGNGWNLFAQRRQHGSQFGHVALLGTHVVWHPVSQDVKTLEVADMFSLLKEGESGPNSRPEIRIASSADRADSLCGFSFVFGCHGEEVLNNLQFEC